MNLNRSDAQGRLCLQRRWSFWTADGSCSKPQFITVREDSSLKKKNSISTFCQADTSKLWGVGLLCSQVSALRVRLFDRVESLPPAPSLMGIMTPRAASNVEQFSSLAEEQETDPVMRLWHQNFQLVFRYSKDFFSNIKEGNIFKSLSLCLKQWCDNVCHLFTVWHRNKHWTGKQLTHTKNNKVTL